MRFSPLLLAGLILSSNTLPVRAEDRIKDDRVPEYRSVATAAITSEGSTLYRHHVPRLRMYDLLAQQIVNVRKADQSPHLWRAYAGGNNPLAVRRENCDIKSSDVDVDITDVDEWRWLQLSH